MTETKQASVETKAKAAKTTQPARLQEKRDVLPGPVVGVSTLPSVGRKRHPLLRLPVLAVLAAVLLAITITFFVVRGWGGSKTSQPFETVEVRRGDLVATVSATGTLSAVGTVTVGTQVSGTIERVLADFNDRVTEGDLLAVLDAETLDAAVSDAEASVSRTQAALRQTEAESGRAESQVAQAEAQQAEADAALTRNRTLFEEGYIAEQDFAPRQTAAATAKAGVESAIAQVASAKAGIASAKAGVGSAEAQLAQARKNRSNAEIRAPISGLIIERSVDAGQTVAASFSTPTLFVIAEDLAKMEILARVDESDIGLVDPGQPVEFTVAAYPGRKFAGTARERRLQPETIQNVVHYTVVVTADNESGLLLPGMTATLDFIVDRLQDTLLVPAAALRFNPPSDIRAAARTEQRREEEQGKRDNGPSQVQTTPAFSPDVAELWTPGEGRNLRPLLVRVLATDGAATAIAPLQPSNDAVRPGLEVVTRMKDREDKT